MDCVGTRLMKSTHFTYYMHSAVKYKNKRETGTAITTTTTIRFQLRAVTTALSCGGVCLQPDPTDFVSLPFLLCIHVHCGIYTVHKRPP